MSKSSKKLLAILGGLAVLGIYTTSPEAEARPQYAKGFITNYPKLEEAAKKAKCGLCHEGVNKKVRNAYGKAVEEGVNGKKNEKDIEAIGAALKKAAEGKSEGGKTFGEMIASGELPK
jgi:hypothetical protein